MTAPHLINRFVGLFASTNPVDGRAPEGAMDVAENLIIRQPNVLEPRRGYSSASFARNLLYQSQAMATSPWTSTATTVTNNSTTAPDGTNTATLITNAGGFTGVLQLVAGLSAGTYTVSVWLKAASGTVATYINFDSGASGAPSINPTITTTWQRYTFSFVPTSTTGTINITAQLGAQTFYAWGAQLEMNTSATAYSATAATLLTATNVIPANAVAFKQSKAICLTYNNPATNVTGELRQYDPATASFTNLPMNPGGFEFNSPGGSSTVDTRFVSANKAVYFQSRYGLTKIEDIGAGVCRPCIQPVNWTSTIGSPAGTTVSVVNGGTVNWLGNGFQTAYRFTICRKGANNELIESEPSERLIVSNTSGSAGYVSVSLSLSWMIPPDSFFRVYRSKAQVANGTDTSDEMYLMAEAFPSATQRTLLDANGYMNSNNPIVIKDLTSDGQLYTPLYSNAITGEGSAQGNAAATLSNDLALFKQRLYFFNTTDVQRFTIKVIGTGTGGIVDGDTITVDGVVFVFRTTPVQTYDCKVYTAGPLSQNIENTARYFEAVINLYFYNQWKGSGVFIPSVILARYISAGSADAGQVLLQRVVPGATAFTVTTSSANGWGSDYTSGANSDPNTQIAGLMWSKPNQPEATPLANSTIVGDASIAGRRAIPLKDSMFLFKDGDGVWKVTDDGSSVGPVVTLFDPTIHLLAPETAVAMDNVVVALCEDGVQLISEMGKINISENKIQKDLLKLIANVGRSNIARYAHAVANQAEHTYVLSLPESSSATTCTRQYVFNLETQAWTSWTLPGTQCGAINPDTGQIVWGMGSNAKISTLSNALWIERRNYDSTDYQDPGFTTACPGGNLLLWSQAMATAPWDLGGCTVTNNAGTAPDGTNTATQVTSNTAFHGVTQGAAGSSPPGTYTISVWAKCAAGTVAGQFVLFGSDFSTLAVLSFTATTTWQRLTLTGFSPLSNPVIQVQVVTLGQSLLLWGAQLERESVATGYVATTTAALAPPTSSFAFVGDQTQAISVGDLIQQPQTTYFLQQRVKAVTYGSTLNQTAVTVDSAPSHPWDTTVNLTILKAVQDKWRLLPVTVDGPLTVKNWGDVLLAFRYLDADNVSVGFATEVYPITSTALETISGLSTDSPPPPIVKVPWLPDTTAGFGQNVWGRQTRDVVLKFTVPLTARESAQLTMTYAFANAVARFELNAINVQVTGQSDRVVR